MTPRLCRRCFCHVPKASRCPSCGSVAFQYGQPFPDLREQTVAFTLGRSKKQARWLDEALSFDRSTQKPVMHRTHGRQG